MNELRLPEENGGLTGEPSVSPKVKGLDLRLLPPAAAVWVGAIAGLQFGGTECEWVLLATGAACLVLLGFRRMAVVAVALLALCLAYAVGGAAARSLAQDPLQEAARKSLHVVVIGEVASFPKVPQVPWKRDSLETVLNVKSVTFHGQTSSSVAQLQLDIADLRNPGVVGTVVIPKGTVIQINGVVSEPSFRRGTEVGQMSVDSFATVRKAPAWQRLVAQLRFSMSEVAGEAAGPEGPLITGMAIGDDSALNRRSKQAMLTTSLTHLTAVSGSHIAISLAVLHLAFRGRPRIQAVMVGAFLVLTLVVVGAEASVVRATSMSGLAAWGMFRRRPGQPLALLFVVIIVVILLDPWVALSLGFALSAIATFGILTLGRSMSQTARTLIMNTPIPPGGIGQRALLAAADIVAISTSAFVVGLPILALINPWLPTWGIVANLAVAPIVAPLTYLGLGVAVCAIPWPGAAYMLCKGARPLAHWMNAVALEIANWPLARMPWPEGLGGAALLLLFLAAALATWRIFRKLTMAARL